MTFEFVKKVEVPNSKIIENIENSVYGHLCIKIREEIASCLVYHDGLSKEEAENVVENAIENMTVDEISEFFHELLENILKHC